MPRPTPAGALPKPSRLRGWWFATSFMNDTSSKDFARVVAARCADVAETMSPGVPAMRQIELRRQRAFPSSDFKAREQYCAPARVVMSTAELAVVYLVALGTQHIAERAMGREPWSALVPSAPGSTPTRCYGDIMILWRGRTLGPQFGSHDLFSWQALLSVDSGAKSLRARTGGRE